MTDLERCATCGVYDERPARALCGAAVCRGKSFRGSKCHSTHSRDCTECKRRIHPLAAGNPWCTKVIYVVLLMGALSLARSCQ